MGQTAFSKQARSRAAYASVASDIGAKPKRLVHSRVFSFTLGALSLLAILAVLVMAGLFLISQAPTTHDVKTTIATWGGVATLVVIGLGGSLWRIFRPH